MPKNLTAQTRDFKFGISARDQNYTVSGKTHQSAEGYLACIESVLDNHKRDLAFGVSELTLTTAAYLKEIDALTAAGAIALALIDRKLSNGNDDDRMVICGRCGICGSDKPPCGSLPLSLDLLRGAGEIALFVLGEDNKSNRRSVYNWHENSTMPIARMGGVLVSRRSLLCQHLNRQLCAPASCNGAKGSV